jgi:5'(3')-deoxyribonucleotidase
VKEQMDIKKIIAIDLDDTLNDFTKTLQETIFTYSDTFPFTEEIFNSYLNRLRSGRSEDSDLLSTEYSYFQYQIHEQCYRLAKARTDGIEFMQWLKNNGWQVVICTRRDLRRAHDCTVKWLKENQIPFDYLFMAWNKIVFCKLWRIEHLVDDAIFNIVHGGNYGVNVYYPLMEKHHILQGNSAKGFKTFNEVKQWLQS